MTLEQLRIFVAVAERQHVTEAARALNLTQSAASAAIASLEERHDVRLFDRVGRRIELTDTGRMFLPEARSVLARAEEAAAMLSAVTDLRHGRLRIAASHTVANYWLPPLLSLFHVAHPGIDCVVRIANSARVEADVLEGEVDLGFVEDTPRDDALASVDVARDQLALIVGRDHPFSGREGIDRDDLVAADWIMREPGSGTRTMLEKALEHLGIARNAIGIALELPSNEAVRSAVLAGAGIAALSRLVVESSIEEGRLKVLPFDLPVRHFSAVHHRQRHISRAAAAFLSLAHTRSDP
ncbi:LysR family transcriptional regulator [Aureimonas mangrovi]|uniref:LysR family transcriptional regulator n=1 Tax=Aureimonas mangrovi TaxID=2758041 RepID=UPI00163D9F49|nr:LysR family transcriptional regulator [Aureimonas mangrovi]